MGSVSDFISQNTLKSGRTTRLVNKYVQSFFNRGTYTPIFVKDHTDGNDDRILSIVEERLKREHGAKCDSDYIINYDEHYIIRISDKQSERRKRVVEMAMALNQPMIRVIPELARATGMSTLIVDETIEQLFHKEGKWVIVRDHYNSPIADDIILKKVCQRLEAEHPSVEFETEKRFFRIRIKKSEE